MKLHWEKPIAVPTGINSLAPDRCGNDLKWGMFKLISKLDILSISCITALRWVRQDLDDD